MDAKTLNEGQMINLVRNALLVAGHEMGEDGDHWPVIKSTIHQIMRDWENVQIERNTDAEMKIHLYQQLAIMERGLPDCAPDVQADLAPRLKELREIYDAYFSAVDEKVEDFSEQESPLYVQRAEAIVTALGE